MKLNQESTNAELMISVPDGTLRYFVRASGMRGNTVENHWSVSCHISENRTARQSLLRQLKCRTVLRLGLCLLKLSY